MDTLLQTQNHRTVREFLNRHVTAIDITASILIVLLVMSNVLAYVSYRELEREFMAARNKEVALRTNEQVLAFATLFIDRVLKAEGEIDFETRLKLESSVRDLNNDEILVAWQQFTDSQSEQQAQQAVKRLLSVLVSHIQ